MHYRYAVSFQIPKRQYCGQQSYKLNPVEILTSDAQSARCCWVEDSLAGLDCTNGRSARGTHFDRRVYRQIFKAKGGMSAMPGLADLYQSGKYRLPVKLEATGEGLEANEHETQAARVMYVCKALKPNRVKWVARLIRRSYSHVVVRSRESAKFAVVTHFVKETISGCFNLTCECPLGRKLLVLITFSVDPVVRAPANTTLLGHSMYWIDKPGDVRKWHHR